MNLEQAEILIKTFEGLRLKAYKDPVGILTIGYGHTQGVKEGMRITPAQAQEFLKEDIEQTLNGLRIFVKTSLNHNQLAALVSFVFNVGITAFAKSTMLKLINSGNIAEAANQFDKWIHAGGKVLKGLELRRAAEKKLFLTPGND